MQLLAIELDVNEKLCIRNPQRTDLGRKILKNSILLLNEIGFERFTFKKLAQQMDSTEASIYRYFESKHLLLLYLLNWYWEWIKFSIGLRLMNISKPQEKLRAVISTIVDTAKRNAKVDFIDEDILHRIVVVEGTKAYHSKEVDEQNKEGFFLSYKSLCQKIADILLEINPLFPYPRAMASNLLEMANNHIYFAQHLPRLTDIENDSNVMQKVEDLLLFFAFKLINPTGEESAVLKKDEKKKRMLIQDIS
ncbi:MAG: TetR family transcriptional regulator [Saprospiraceae bacterium]|nr:TetR family transcriptional regulator [Saprospiraceae bacterium]